MSDEYVDVTERPESHVGGGSSQANGGGDHLGVDGPRQAKKKVNPLVDLIDTEKAYVDLLAAIIRRVAAAWSRSNFPPPELDAVFRSVEVVYRANRGLLAKLNDIGPNPSSPKALGDLLMRWIDDLEAPYTRYCDGYTTSFDTWAPVQSNPNLRRILEDISATIPPSNYATSLDPIWTLDTLFLMPATRIKYYKKLYARLLKSTQPGRSDHKLLLGANDRLANLLATVEARSEIRVGGDARGPPPREDTLSPAVSPPPRKSSAAPGATPSPGASRPMSPQVQQNRSAAPSPLPGARERERNSPPPPPPPERDSRAESNSSGRDSRNTEGRDSRGSVPTSNTSAGPRTSTSTMNTPIIDLERRLSTARVLDIFTMAPRKCRLQMAPPNLPFPRRLRFSADVVINFTPRSTGVEVTHRNAHIYLLTDLFLVSERMSEDERRGPEGREGADMWLCYPPLSAKHIIVADMGGPDDNSFEVRIMKKEVLVIHAESRSAKESMLQDFRESYEEAMSLAPPPSNSRSLGPGGPADPSRSGSQGPGGFPQRSASSGFPDRALTQSPPTGDFGMEPPRAQFGRLTTATASDPNLPGAGAGGSSSDPSIYTPPPRGTSRNMGPAPPSLPRTNSADNLPPGARSENSILRLNTGPPGPHGPGGGERDLHRRPSDPNALPPLPPSPLPPFPGQPGAQYGGPSAPGFIDSPHQQFHHGQPFSPGGGPPPPPRDGPPSSYPGQREPGMPSGAPSMRSFDTTNSSRQPSINSSYHGGPPGRGGPGGYNGGPHGMGPGGPNGYPGGGGGPQGGGAMLNRQDSVDSVPSSPEEGTRPLPSGPVTSTITAQMKCKVFLKQHHAQWKALGAAKLLLYQQEPGNVKQLVVEQENRAKTLLISTIVLMDAVERVGKTGVAIELSDQGQRTGIVYMIQLKSETSASGFFGTLLAGSDRSGGASG